MDESSNREFEDADVVDFAQYRNDRVNRGRDQGIGDFIKTFDERLTEEDKREVDLAVNASMKAIEPTNIIMEMAMTEGNNTKRFMMLAKFSQAIISKVAEEFGYDEKQIDLTAGVYFDSLGQILNLQLNPPEHR